VTLLAVADPALSAPPLWRVVHVLGRELACLDGAAEGDVALLSCAERCTPIPWQLDERDARGRFALDRGPEPSFDDPPNRIDGDDEVVWMLDDSGRRATARELPAATCVVEVCLSQDDFEGWVYLVRMNGPAPRSPLRYVRYEPAADRVEAARFVVGFRGPTPQYFVVRSAAGRAAGNLLDRLKVRAYARFLGLIPIWRDEDDLETQLVGWREGPIRVVRRLRQWVRLGWGLRTPVFRTDTFVYRDYSQIPVVLRLNFPPTYFFRGIVIRGVLDFRDLNGWRLMADGLSQPILIGDVDEDRRRRLNELSGDWFALLGEDVTLIQTLEVGPSLRSVRRLLVYREDGEGRPPEAVVGEKPGVGYGLVDWGDVDRGHHRFTSSSYAVPAGYDVGRFLRLNRMPIRVEARRIE
jgi:hypothetical protein